MVKDPVGIIGAGLVGLATARQLALSGVPVVVWEKEAAVARHQSGHNSGVVHAGIYYPPGSAKAENCRRGAELLRAYCAGRGLPWDERGKLVVARDEAETRRLREIERRALANGVPGVRWLDGPAIRALEPDVAGAAALLSPTQCWRAQYWRAQAQYRKVTSPCSLLTLRFTSGARRPRSGRGFPAHGNGSGSTDTGRKHSATRSALSSWTRRVSTAR